MAVTSSAKPWYFNWMVPLIPYEKALRAQVVQKWHHLPYPLLATQWHGIGKDTLPQGSITTWGRLESWWETILVCHLLQHRGNRTLYPTWAVHWSWPHWPWCRQAYFAITRVKALTLWSLPHLVCIVVACMRERWPLLALWLWRELAPRSPEWDNWLCPSHVQHTEETPILQDTH